MNHEHILLMNKREVIQAVIRQFAHTTGIRPRLTEGGQGLTLAIPVDGQLLTFRIIQRNEVRAAHILQILEEIGKDKERWILVTQYIPQPLKDELRKQGVNYLETAGNGFIRAGTFFYFMGGQAVTPLRQPATGKLWKRTGLQFLLVILTNPDALQDTYRVMADMAGIALGNIGQLLEELQRADYLEKDGDVFRLKNRGRLYERWAELYPVILKPKLTRGRFRFLREGDRLRWQDMPRQHFRWGGEPGGALYTGFLEPERFTIYTNERDTETIKQLALVPDPNGTVEIVEQFWKEKAVPGEFIGAAPALLVYAELMDSLDSRNRETALRIKNKYLDV